MDNLWIYVDLMLEAMDESTGGSGLFEAATDEIDLHLLRTVGQQCALGRDDIEFASVTVGWTGGDDVLLN